MWVSSVWWRTRNSTNRILARARVICHRRIPVIEELSAVKPPVARIAVIR
jgi:hypothetical protein